MPLPELIEIGPLTQPARAEVTVPGSKSITNRALVLAALAEGETILSGALWSEDTQVMVECLRELGFPVNVEPEPHEPGNRRITIYGQGGQVPRGGTEAQPLQLFVGNAGTAARFLTALVSLGQGCYRLHGVPRMHERPQAALILALRELGYRVDSPNDRLPVTVHGGGPRPGACQVSIAQSSQFASALLLASRAGGWTVRVQGQNAEESPYVEMTRQLLAAFPRRGGAFAIEPDASSGSYFLAAGWLCRPPDAPPLWPATQEPVEDLAGVVAWLRQHSITVAHWPRSGWQIDQQFPRYLAFPETISREADLGDSIMTAMVLAPFAPAPIRFTDLGRLRLQECERVAALRSELTRCGARVIETGDTLQVFPSPLHGAEIETYHDHRVAMCFAILGLKVPGIKIKNPACVKKTFPNFFQKLATPPPFGPGAAIWDGATRRALEPSELLPD